jgi:hypothetical protein
MSKNLFFIQAMNFIHIKEIFQTLTDCGSLLLVLMVDGRSIPD